MCTTCNKSGAKISYLPFGENVIITVMKKDLWTHLKETEKPVVLYGTGNGADKIIAKMEKDGTYGKVQGIFASSGFVRDRYFRGMKVESFEGVTERLGLDIIVLMCFGSSRPEVLENVYKISSLCEFYAPDVPVYGTDIFDTAYYEANKDKIDRVTALLADDLSRKTMFNTVTNKLTGELSPLLECEVSKRDADMLLDLPEGAVFVDLGAYNGDTILHYSSLFPQIKKVYGVEPDKRNFRKLKENTSGLSLDITYVNALISDCDGISFAGRNKGRGVHEQDQGDEIRSVTVDSILKGSPCDFIKFDVEGNEIKAICGAEDTISSYKPSMQIACYHRSGDIFEIPLTVLDINPDYKVYMRHTPHVPGWDTQFYFV